MGFLTGVIVGAAVASSSGSAPPAGASLVTSEQHDVIMCETSSRQPGLCIDVASPIDGGWRTVTPNVYAGWAGYKKIYKKAVMFANDSVYIVMEVSK